MQRYAIELSLELKKHLKEEVVFVAPKNILDNKLSEVLEVIRVGNFTGHVWEQLELTSYVTRRKGFLINLCNTAPVLYQNKLVVLHDIAFERFPMNFSLLFRTFYRVFIPYILRRSKYIVTDSEFSKEEICNFYQINADLISVIHCAVSADFKPLKIGQEAYVLAVSSISPHKNFRALVLAFNKLDEIGLELRIVGDVGTNFSDAGLLKLIETNKRIKILGRVTDKELRQLYSKALCFVYPSLYEGFGIPPLEAQASGCPCLVSKVASLPEVCGDSVLYCDPYSINDMAIKLEALVADADLRRKLKVSGLRNVKRFSWKQSASRLIEIIQGEK